MLKKSVSILFIVISMVLLSGCGGGGSSDTTNENQNGLQSITTQRTIEPFQELNITINGKNSDIIKIKFDKYSLDTNSTNLFGEELNITLNYDDKGLLSGISFNKDLNFSTPVQIHFNSESLKGTNRYLMYVKDGVKQYYVPFTKDSTGYTYYFNHFSDYEFDPSSSNADTAYGEAQTKLQELHNQTDKSGGPLSIESDLGSIIRNIAILETLDEGDSRMQTLWDAMGDVITEYLEAFVAVDPSFDSYINSYNNCINDEFLSYMRTATKNFAIYEELGTHKANLEYGDFIKTHVEKLTNEYLGNDPKIPDICYPENFISCAVKVIAFAEESGLNEAQIEVLLDHLSKQLEKQVDTILAMEVNAEKSNCAYIVACAEHYLKFIDYMPNISESKIDALRTKKEEVATECQQDCPFTWNISLDVISYDKLNNEYTISTNYSNINILTNEQEENDDPSNYEGCDGIETTFKQATTIYDANYEYPLSWDTWGENMLGFESEGGGFSVSMDPYMSNIEDGGSFTLADTRETPNEEIVQETYTVKFIYIGNKQ